MNSFITYCVVLENHAWFSTTTEYILKWSYHEGSRLTAIKKLCVLNTVTKIPKSGKKCRKNPKLVWNRRDNSSTYFLPYLSAKIPVTAAPITAATVVMYGKRAAKDCLSQTSSHWKNIKNDIVSF